MNFADKLKKDNDLTAPDYDDDFINSLMDQEEVSFTAQMETDIVKKLLPTKELNANDVTIAGIRVIEEALADPEIRQDKTFILLITKLMTTFLGDVVERLFGCGVHIEPILKDKEGDEENE